MKIAVKFIFHFVSAGALIFGSAGCANYSEKIIFPSEALMAPAPPDPQPIGMSKLAKAEIAQIESVIFEDLLQRHLGDDGKYSAVFLHASQTTTQQLMKKFPHHTPPIKQLWHLELRDAQSPLDRDTQQAAMVLSVETLEPENDMVQAIGRWNGGEAVKGFYQFDLKKYGQVWTVAK